MLDRLFLLLAAALILAPSRPAQAANTPPVISYLSLDYGASVTKSRKIRVVSAVTPAATGYRISEKSSFKKAIWRAYNQEALFQLSSSAGKKQVYFQVRAGTAVSRARKAVITLGKKAPASVTAVTINGAASVTTERAVNVTLSVTGTPRYMMCSEDRTFAGAAWQAYSSRITYELSSGAGTKRLYVRLKDKVGIGPYKAGDIALAAPPVVNSFTPSASTTESRDITFTATANGDPSSLMISENEDFSGAAWQTWSGTIAFTLSSGSGTKRVYFKIRNAYAESAALFADIVLAESSHSAGDTVIEPSPGDQSIPVGSLFNLTIPANSFSTPVRVTITQQTNPASFPISGVDPLFSYTFEVTGVSSTLAVRAPVSDADNTDVANSTVYMKYNPAALRQDLGVADQISLYVLDTESEINQALQYGVDYVGQRLIFALSLGKQSAKKVVAYIPGSDYALHSTRHFSIYFRPSPYGRTPFGEPYEFAVLTGRLMEAAWEAYGLSSGYTVAQGAFAVPWTPRRVYCELGKGDAVAQYSSILGYFYIPYRYSSEAQLRQDASHELFHSVQSAYFILPTWNELGMRWFIEATANLAPCYAGIECGGGMSDGLKWDFLTHGVTYDPDFSGTDMHKYGVAYFLQYVVQTVPGGGLSGLWNYIVESGRVDSGGVLTSVEEFVSNGGYNLGVLWRDWAKYYIFSSQSPMPAIDHTFTQDVANYTSTSAADRESVPQHFTLPADYSGMLWSMRNTADHTRYMKVSLDALSNNEAAAVLAAPSDNRLLAVDYGLLQRSAPDTGVAIPAGGYLYVLGTSGSRIQTEFDVTATDQTPLLAGVNTNSFTWNQEVIITGKRLTLTPGDVSVLMDKNGSLTTLNITGTPTAERITAQIPPGTDGDYKLYVYRVADHSLFPVGAFPIGFESQKLDVTVSPLPYLHQTLGIGGISAVAALHASYEYRENGAVTQSGIETITSFGSGSCGGSFSLPPVAWTGNSFASGDESTQHGDRHQTVSISGSLDQSGMTLNNVRFTLHCWKDPAAGTREDIDETWLDFSVSSLPFTTIESGMVQFSKSPVSSAQVALYDYRQHQKLWLDGHSVPSNEYTVNWDSGALDFSASSASVSLVAP